MNPPSTPAALEIPFRALTELAPDATVVADEQGVVAYANRAADELLGYPPGGIEGCRSPR